MSAPACAKADPLSEAGAREILERMALAGNTVWPRDIELAAKAVQGGKRVVLLGCGSVLYVSAGEL